MLHEWTPITQFESQRNIRRVYEDRSLWILGRDTTPMNASDSNRCAIANLKGPSCTKNSTESKFSTEWIIATEIAKHSVSVNRRFSNGHFSAELKKLEKNPRDGGQRQKVNP